MVAGLSIFIIIIVLKSVSFNLQERRTSVHVQMDSSHYDFVLPPSGLTNGVVQDDSDCQESVTRYLRTEIQQANAEYEKQMNIMKKIVNACAQVGYLLPLRSCAPLAYAEEYFFCYRILVKLWPNGSTAPSQIRSILRWFKC